MRFSIYINQKRAIEWGLTLQSSALFALIYDAATWAERDENGEYWWLSRDKIVEELPILTDQADTAYRMWRKLVEKGLIEYKKLGKRDYFRVTRKGMRWNGDIPFDDPDTPAESSENFPDSEIFPSLEGNSENFPSSENYPQEARKIIRKNSEIFPKKLGKFSDRLNNKYIHKQNNTQAYVDDFERPVDNSTATPEFSRVTGLPPVAKLMAIGWRPDDHIFDVLWHNHGVEPLEAEQELAEFVLYWYETGSLSARWNKKFFDRCVHLKRTGHFDRIAAQRARSVRVATRDLSMSEQLQDRSWAEPGTGSSGNQNNNYSLPSEVIDNG